MMFGLDLNDQKITVFLNQLLSTPEGVDKNNIELLAGIGQIHILKSQWFGCSKQNLRCGISKLK